jgi:hypothetical protein
MGSTDDPFKAGAKSKGSRICFAGSDLGDKCHICAFFNSRDDEYRALIPFIWMQQPSPVNPAICTYDLTRFSGETVIDVMRTHPMTLIGGVLQENPFFVPPEDFIHELRERRTGKSRR